MAPPTPPDIGLERHRQRLELSLDKLRKAQRHWQIASAEYEAFREELQALPPGAGRADMLAAGMEFGGTVVDEKEIKALLGDKMGIQRSLGQVVTAVGHRISYVQENIAKLAKQIEHGETRLAALLVVAAPDPADEDGLPIVDIREELDEDGNVVAATVNGSDPRAPAKAPDTAGLERLVAIAEEEDRGLAQTPGTSPRNPSPLREVVTQDQPRDAVAISSATGDGGGGGLVKILDDAPEKAWVQAVPGESAEATELRREMLKYNMAEIGAVVAEINLDEDGDFYGYEDSDDDDYEEDEDEYGRATYTVITPELQREMEELQQRVAERGQGGQKKGVRFAPELDISPAPPPPPPPEFPVPPSALNEADAIPLLLDLLAMDEARKAGLQPARGPGVSKPARTVPAAALAPTVLERSAPSIYTNTTPHAPPDDGVRQPALFSAVTERTPPSTAAAAPDELDPSLHRREVARELHRMRTKLIQQQGGFAAREDDGATVPLAERRVSRFKAARLKMGQP